MNRTPDWLKAIGPKLPSQKPYQKAFMPIQPIQGRASTLSPYAPKVSTGTAPGAIEGQSGFTGTSSPTGEIRPMNRVNRRVDEGELVLNAQDTRNVGDLAMGLVSLSRQGKLTPDVTNQLKGLMGQPLEQRMAGGTIVYDDQPVRSSWSNPNPDPVPPPEQRMWDGAAGIAAQQREAGMAAQQQAATLAAQQQATAAGIAAQQRTAGMAAQQQAATLAAQQQAAGIANQSTGTPSTGLTGARNYQNLATGRLADISAGQSPLYAAMSNKLQQELAVKNAAEQGVQRQSIAQRGLTGTGIAGAESAALGSVQRSAAADLAAKTAQAQMGEMAGATTALAGQANTMANQEYIKKTDAMGQLLKSGNFDAYAKAYKETYGTDIDVNALKTADNASRFSSASSELETALMRPNASMSDTDVQMALNAMWTSSGKVGPMDSAWAQRELTSRREAANPITKAANVYTEDTIKGMGYSPEQISAFSYKGKAGMAAVSQAMIELASPGGGMTFNKDGSWSFSNTTSGAYKFIESVINGDGGVVQEAAPGTAKTAEAEWGTASRLDFAELSSNDYSDWKNKYYTNTGTSFSADSIPALTVAARRGNVDAQKDLTSTLVANPPAPVWSNAVTRSEDAISGGGPSDSEAQFTADGAAKVAAMDINALVNLYKTRGMANPEGTLSDTEKRNIEATVKQVIQSRIDWTTANIGKLPITDQQKKDILKKMGMSVAYWPDSLRNGYDPLA